MIYDVFNFFNELELLEIRLHELDDYVDRFVLVESTSTFQNNPKKLYYEENKEQFKQWHHKITHVIIDDSPQTTDTWAVETFQFNAATRGLQDLKPNDTVIWCCADEIANKNAVQQNRGGAPKMLMMTGCSIYMNCWHANMPLWTGGRLVTGKQWIESNNQYDSFRKHWLGHHVLDGGWHFCNLGDVERLKLKFQSYAHKELNNDHFLGKLQKSIDGAGNLYFEETQERMSVLPWDRMPKYIVENKQKFRHLLLPSTVD